MIVESGTSSRHGRWMAAKRKGRLSGRGIKNISMEGTNSSDWVVMDIGDVIVHIFRPEVREFYNIEKMWGTDSPVHLVHSHNVTSDQVSA